MLAVLRHAHGGRQVQDAAAGKAVEGRIEHRAQNLAHAVRPEVEAKHAVAVMNAAIVADHGGQHELVAEVVRIGVGDHRVGVGEARAFGLHDGAIGPDHALPTLVAIHGVVAADDGRDRYRWRQRIDQAHEVVPGRARRRVATVGKGMHHGWHASPA